MEKSGIDLRGRIGPVGRNRRDVKSRTMNRFTVLDEDIGSKYDYDDEDSVFCFILITFYFNFF